jgi:hypothetical protein
LTLPTSRSRSQLGQLMARRLRVISPLVSRALAAGQAAHLHAQGEFAEDVREPGAGVAASDIEHPFPEDRGFDQDIEHDRVAHRGARARQVAQILAADNSHIAPGQHLHAVIGDIEIEVLEVECVARNVNRQDLPLTIAGVFLPVGETGHQHAALIRNIPFPGEVGRRFQRPETVRQGQDRLAILR